MFRFDSVIDEPAACVELRFVEIDRWRSRAQRLHAAAITPGIECGHKRLARLAPVGRRWKRSPATGCHRAKEQCKESYVAKKHLACSMFIATCLILSHSFRASPPAREPRARQTSRFMLCGMNATEPSHLSRLT